MKNRTKHLLFILWKIFFLVSAWPQRGKTNSRHSSSTSRWQAPSRWGKAGRGQNGAGERRSRLAAAILHALLGSLLDTMSNMGLRQPAKELVERLSLTVFWHCCSYGSPGTRPWAPAQDCPMHSGRGFSIILYLKAKMYKSTFSNKKIQITKGFRELPILVPGLLINPLKRL